MAQQSQKIILSTTVSTNLWNKPVVLNPNLHRRLELRLPGGVRHICKEGERAEVRNIVDIGSGRSYTRRLNGGEEYVCQCPFCGDTNSRGHLYINYQYGTLDPHAGGYNTHLATCFRRNCLSKFTNREDLERRILGDIDGDATIELAEEASSIHSKEPGILLPVKPPGKILPINLLPPTNPAIRYLKDRNFDIQELEKLWKVGYCIAPCDFHAEGRIYIPIMMEDILIGWQARYPGELNWKGNVKKYYNLRGMPKRLMLYNYDLAIQEPVVVITEGVTDVWRIGPPGIALLGKSLSAEHIKLIVKNWGDRVIIVLMDSNDPDASIAAAKICDLLAPHVTGKLMNIRLPNGCDPGGMDREGLWVYMTTWARGQGVELPECTSSYGG